MQTVDSVPTHNSDYRMFKKDVMDARNPQNNTDTQNFRKIGTYMFQVLLFVTVLVRLLPGQHLVKSLRRILRHSLLYIACGFLHSILNSLDCVFYSILCLIFGISKCNRASAAGLSCKHVRL